MVCGVRVFSKRRARMRIKFDVVMVEERGGEVVKRAVKLSSTEAQGSFHYFLDGNLVRLTQ